MKPLALVLLALLSQAAAAKAPIQPPGQRAPPAAAAPQPLPLQDRLAAALQSMRAALANVRDFTCVLYKTEYKRGPLPLEKMQLKLRTSPRSVYMKWVGARSRGQEVLWRPGWNDGKLKAHPGSFPDLTVNLSVDARLAMSTSRHPVSLTGFVYTVDMLERDIRLTARRPQCFKAARDLGMQEVHGAQAHCYDVEMDKAACKELYAYRALFCVHEELKVPVRVQIWDLEDGLVRLVEDYGYEGVKLNVGLTDADFDPENPSYDF